MKRFFVQEVALECQDMNWGTFKTVLTDALIEHLHPIQVTDIAELSFIYLFIFFLQIVSVNSLSKPIRFNK